MKNLWKDGGKKQRHDDIFESTMQLPKIVLGAVALLMLFFIAGSVYLIKVGLFTHVEILHPREVAVMTVVTSEYHGSLWGIEKARQKVLQALQTIGMESGQPITIFSQSPMKLRATSLRCQVGYILPIGYSVRGLPDFTRVQTISPGKCIIVRVQDSGNYTGFKAYRVATEKYRETELQPSDGIRFEVHIKEDQINYVEHWIPIRP